MQLYSTNDEASVQIHEVHEKSNVYFTDNDKNLVITKSIRCS